MKVTNIRMPTAPFEIIKNGDGYNAVFYNNVKEIKDSIDGMTGQKIAMWQYDKYVLPIEKSSNIYVAIENNFAEWLEKAKDYELDEEAAKVRAYRDKLLNDCDTIYCNASNWELKGDKEKALWQNYKQKLRDIPQQKEFPYQVIFPAMPELNREEEY